MLREKTNRFQNNRKMSFQTPKKTKSRTSTPAFHHHRKSTPSKTASTKRKNNAAKTLLRQMYQAARFHKWKYTMYGWTKWKDLTNFNRLRDIWKKMEQTKKIASINTALNSEVQELLGANEARFFLKDPDSELLFSQSNPESDPIITTVGGLGLVGYVASSRKVIRMKRLAVSNSSSPSKSPNKESYLKPPFPFQIIGSNLPKDSSPADLFDATIDVSTSGGMKGTKNGLCVPILNNDGNTLVGVCQVINRFEGNFSDDDVELLQDFVVFARDHVLERQNQGDIISLLKAAEKWKIDKKNAANESVNYFQYMRVGK